MLKLTMELRFSFSLPFLLFHIMFAVNAENYDPFGIWTLLKMVLTPLNVNRYRLLKINGVKG
jgi:hypothetical protein